MIVGHHHRQAELGEERTLLRLDRPEDWGQVVSRGRDGEPGSRDLGGGEQVFTLVVWGQ